LQNTTGVSWISQGTATHASRTWRTVRATGCGDWKVPKMLTGDPSKSAATLFFTWMGINLKIETGAICREL
jgi:hypothetical protein